MLRRRSRQPAVEYQSENLLTLTSISGEPMIIRVDEKYDKRLSSFGAVVLDFDLAKGPGNPLGNAVITHFPTLDRDLAYSGSAIYPSGFPLATITINGVPTSEIILSSDSETSLPGSGPIWRENSGNPDFDRRVLGAPLGGIVILGQSEVREIAPTAVVTFH